MYTFVSRCSSAFTIHLPYFFQIPLALQFSLQNFLLQRFGMRTHMLHELEDIERQIDGVKV